MPALSVGQENTAAILNWFITASGNLVDAYEVSYKVYDIIDGLPGTQVFPETGWMDNTSSPGRFDTGSYYAYDSDSSAGFTPDVTYRIGTYRIYWRWRITSTSPYQVGGQDFEILSQPNGNTYITIHDVRNAGLDDDVEYPDTKITASIELWQSVLERACRQWFYQKPITINADGTDSDTLHFGVPIIGIDYIKLNNSSDELDDGLYRVYNSIAYPDDRRNPRIKLIRTDDYRDIYTAPMVYGDLRFRKGRQNQQIKGVFGYVEEDGSTPRPIKHALLELVMEKITKQYVATGSASSGATPPPIVGSMLEEWTDGHRIKYANPGSEMSKRSAYLSGITNNQLIIEVIKMYRAPIGCATPPNNSYR